MRPLACGPGVPERATCCVGSTFRVGVGRIFVRGKVSVANAVGALEELPVQVRICIYWRCLCSMLGGKAIVLLLLIGR